MKKALGKKKCNCTDVDCYRVKRYLGYFVKRSRSKEFSEFKRDLNAVLDHLFNNHTYCSQDWCPVLKAEATGQDVSKLDLKHHCKTKDKVLYEQMKEAVAKYFTDEYLKQMNHDYDSQK